MFERQKFHSLLVVAALLATAWLQLCMADTNMCLNMIIKDEADEVKECLDAIHAELSGWTLCDTGSTDGTPDVVSSFFNAKRVPGSVAHHDWKDFGHNRNLCIQEGVKWSLEQAKQRGMAEGSHFCDYFLFLDADQVLQLPAGAKPGDLKAMNLTKDVYYMTERGINLSYNNIRLASTRLQWEWVGEVHEYVHRVDGVPAGENVIEGYQLKHDASGGKDGGRFVRDEQILSRVVKERPKDARAHFYLANTYRALDKVEEAIRHYIIRIRLGGWDEERYHSALNIAEFARKQVENGSLVSPQIKAHIGNWDSALKWRDNDTELKEDRLLQELHTAIAGGSSTPQKQKQANTLVENRKAREFDWVVAAYTAAMQILPYRPETWARLARLYRERNDHAKCFSYAAAGLAQGPPKLDALFIDTQNQRYNLLDEVCTCAYYVDNAQQQGLAACRQLEQLLVDDLEHEGDNEFLQTTLKRVRKNYGWYDHKHCKTTLDGKGSCPIPE